MSKNGGEPHDNVLTLEEALKRFGRDRGLAPKKSDNPTESKIRYADFASRRDEVKSGAKPPAAPPDLVDDIEDLDAAQDAPEDALEDAPLNSPDQIVAIIDGIPRTFEELQQLAAAEEAFRKDFPDLDDANIETTDTIDEPAPPPAFIVFPRRGWTRDLTISAVGAALMIFAAIFVARPPHRSSATPELTSQNISTVPLKASDTGAGDSITTLVILADSDFDLSSKRHRLKPTELEARVKDELKSRAFPDIGVSVGAKGETYLAGQVFSLDEAETITDIVKHVRGVRRAHFLHPDVTIADGPAYFGVTTAWALDVWGAKVQAVFIGSPADKAGIQPGDVISEFDGKTVPDANAFDDLVATYSPGQRVQFRIWHDGQPEYLVARMGELTTVAAR